MIKLKREFKKDLDLGNNTIHDPSLLKVSEPVDIIPKNTEIEFSIDFKTISFSWNDKKYIRAKAFISLINNYLKKPLPIK